MSMSFRGPTESVIFSRRDLDFLLFEWLDVTALTKRERFAEHDRETFDALLDLAEEVATEHFYPHLRTSDLNEPTFDGEHVSLIPQIGAALDVFAKTGLLSATMDAEVGGAQLPVAVADACYSWFMAANTSTFAYPFLTIGNANLLLTHGTPEQIDTFVRPELAGRFYGTMCLSEPQAGSSLSDVTTKAEPRDDGTYRVFGNKMWISAGDHELGENIVHLVLAKIPGGPPGVKGISLFIVPKFLVNADGTLGERNDVVLAGLNHKMGYRGTTNTLLNFGEGKHTPGGEPGAIGYLVGEAHKGLAYMFTMMNEARIKVGAGAMAVGYTGYLKSLKYAKERPQGRPPAGKDAREPQVPIIEHADVRRMLLAQKSYVEGALALVLYAGTLLDDERTAVTAEERDRAHLLLDTLTPIVKSWPSQWCVEANNLAIQIHGGYGYTREYDVELHYRDNRLNPIHEGTHGIQGLDLLGRKVALRGGAGLTALAAAIQATVADATAAGGELADLAARLGPVVDRVVEVTGILWGAGDADVTLANASVYLEAVGHVVVAWLWLRQALAAAGKDGAFYDGKRAAARYFFRFELPKTGPQLDLLASLDRTTLDADPAWL
jgi:alkylation response protein AidB-like acyl-CoA dehydrogenase